MLQGPHWSGKTLLVDYIREKYSGTTPLFVFDGCADDQFKVAEAVV